MERDVDEVLASGWRGRVALDKIGMKCQQWRKNIGKFLIHDIETLFFSTVKRRLPLKKRLSDKCQDVKVRRRENQARHHRRNDKRAKEKKRLKN